MKAVLITMYNLMFSCVSDTLLTLCRDKKYMGATPGIIMVLHTWGQKLNFHPHIHCALSGGGLTESGQFTESCHKGFLLPVEAMGKMFRGKFMATLKTYYEKKLLSLAADARICAIITAGKISWIPFMRRIGFPSSVRLLMETEMQSNILHVMPTALPSATAGFAA